MADHTLRRERPDEESGVGNGICKTGACERHKRPEGVAERVGPVDGRMTCTEAAGLIARRKCRYEIRIVVKRIGASSIYRHTGKNISKAVIKLARACRRGCTCEINREPAVRRNVLIETIDRCRSEEHTSELQSHSFIS